MEKIVAAALKFGEVIIFVPQPARHYQVFLALREAGFPKVEPPEQGFVTSYGVFVNRYEARKLAEAAGQLIPSYENYEGVLVVRDNPELFSEDVW